MTHLAVRRASVSPAMLIAVFGAAIALRAGLAGAQGAGARGAGLVFAGVLAVGVVACRPVTRLTARVVVVAGLAAVALVAPAAMHVLAAARSWPAPPAGNYLSWGLVTALVATAEEAFLRGALFDAVARRGGPDVAVAVAAVAFGLLHVPFYGWHVLPLDIAVGVVLGVARLLAGSWTAPAVAHVAADLAGWWLL